MEEFVRERSLICLFIILGFKGIDGAFDDDYNYDISYRDWCSDRGGNKNLSEEEELERRNEYLRTKEFCSADNIREYRDNKDKLFLLKRDKRYNEWFEKEKDNLINFFHQIQYKFIYSEKKEIEMFIMLCNSIEEANDNFYIKTDEELDFLCELLRDYNYVVIPCKIKATETFTKYKLYIKLEKE